MATTIQVESVVQNCIRCVETVSDALTGLAPGPFTEVHLIIRAGNPLNDWLQAGDTVTLTLPAHAGPTDPTGAGQ